MVLVLAYAKNCNQLRVVASARYLSPAMMVLVLAYAKNCNQLRVVAENMARPIGHRLCEPYQNLYVEGLPSE